MFSTFFLPEEGKDELLVCWKVLLLADGAEVEIMTSQRNPFVVWGPVRQTSFDQHHKMWADMVETEYSNMGLTWHRRSMTQNWSSCWAKMGTEGNLYPLWTCHLYTIVFFVHIWNCLREFLQIFSLERCDFFPHFPPQTYSAVSRIATLAPSPSLFLSISSSLKLSALN